MSNKRKFKNDIFESIHESAAALRGVGAFNKAAMKEFDESCIDKTPNFKLEQIMQISERTKDHR
jgi:putative transcriptional regulator